MRKSLSTKYNILNKTRSQSHCIHQWHRVRTYNLVGVNQKNKWDASNNYLTNKNEDQQTATEIFLTGKEKPMACRKSAVQRLPRGFPMSWGTRLQYQDPHRPTARFPLVKFLPLPQLAPKKTPFWMKPKRWNRNTSCSAPFFYQWLKGWLGFVWNYGTSESINRYGKMAFRTDLAQQTAETHARSDRPSSSRSPRSGT